jgi:leucyl-tRNA synthetase
MGHKRSLSNEPWPAFDTAKTIENEIEIVLQVNGKVRGKLALPQGTNEQEIERLAHLDANVQRHVEGKKVIRTIVVKNKLVNFVVGG